MHPERIPASRKSIEDQPNITSVTRLLSVILEQMEVKNERALLELLPEIKEKIEALHEAQENLPGAINIKEALLKLYDYREKIEAMRKK